MMSVKGVGECEQLNLGNWRWGEGKTKTRRGGQRVMIKHFFYFKVFIFLKFLFLFFTNSNLMSCFSHAFTHVSL